MAQLDMTSTNSASHNSQVQPAVGGGTPTAPQADAFVSHSVAQKLDADYYAATETGDNSEGIAGSGNLNHALLQAQQNDLLANGGGGDAVAFHDLTLGNLAAGLASRYASHESIGGSGSGQAATEISEATSSGVIESHSAVAAQFIPSTTTQNTSGPAISGGDVFSTTASVNTGTNQPGHQALPEKMALTGPMAQTVQMG